MFRASVVCAVFAVASIAQAQEAAKASFEVKEAKVTSRIEGKQAADDKSTFTTGEKAWIWLKRIGESNDVFAGAAESDLIGSVLVQAGALD